MQRPKSMLSVVAGAALGLLGAGMATPRAMDEPAPRLMPSNWRGRRRNLAGKKRPSWYKGSNIAKRATRLGGNPAAF